MNFAVYGLIVLAHYGTLVYVGQEVTCVITRASTVILNTVASNFLCIETRALYKALVCGPLSHCGHSHHYVAVSGPLSGYSDILKPSLAPCSYYAVVFRQHFMSAFSRLPLL